MMGFSIICLIWPSAAYELSHLCVAPHAILSKKKGHAYLRKKYSSSETPISTLKQSQLAHVKM